MKINGTTEIYKIKTLLKVLVTHVEVVGNYDISEDCLPKNVISNANNIQETYLEDAVDFRQSLNGKDVQGSSAYARTFIFDNLSVQANFICLKWHVPNKIHIWLKWFRKNPRCYLWEYLTIINHKPGELKSDLLTSAPVVLTLNIENLKVSLQTTKVYSTFEKISHKGCHSCAQLATIAIEAYSTCLPGEVQVHIQTLPVSTRVISLTTTPQKYEIQIKVTLNVFTTKYVYNQT